MGVSEGACPERHVRSRRPVRRRSTQTEGKRSVRRPSAPAGREASVETAVPDRSSHCRELLQATTNARVWPGGPHPEFGHAFGSRPACLLVIHGVFRVLRPPLRAPGGIEKVPAGPSGIARFAGAIVAPPNPPERLGDSAPPAWPSSGSLVSTNLALSASQTMAKLEITRRDGFSGRPARARKRGSNTST